MLRFETGGQVVFTSLVRHPGTRPQPWLREAMEDVAGRERFRLVRRSGGSRMREFTTSAKVAKESGGEKKLPDVPFKLDGVDMVCRAPTDAQLAYLMAAASSSRSEADKVAAVLDFFEQMLDKASLAVFRKRLLSTDDSFDFTDAMGIFTHV